MGGSAFEFVAGCDGALVAVVDLEAEIVGLFRRERRQVVLELQVLDVEVDAFAGFVVHGVLLVIDGQCRQLDGKQVILA